jgi:minor extracellular serine protease Vpr
MMPARRSWLLVGRARSTRLGRAAAIALAATALVGAGGAVLAASPTVPGAPVFGRIDPAAIDPAFRPAMARPDRYVTVVLQLAGTPVALAQASAIQLGVTLSTSDRASLRRALRARQDALRPALAKSGAVILGQYQDAYDGIKVRVPAGRLTSLATLPGVVRLAAVPIYHLQNSTSETYTGVPRAWSQGTGLTGAGVKIAIIDSGIDYYHADFGGSGDPADFKADDGLTIGTPAFPNAKVAGGFDFVGDNYDPDPVSDGSPVPSADPDPLDCEGHGTHVAGTAAGFGVTSDGRTYHGPYSAAALASHAFRVPPGAAPGATIYALKVFGCEGGTDVLLDAIDWAVKSRMDVINMSVGGAFGTADSPDAIAVDNAVKAGLVVVAAAGNEGPGAYTTSSPSVAAAAISV